ncbi:uncharacterized protein si:dkey-192k22.2 isoform X3 [Cyclopterus lumpus]|uniref:uncharacterized protein si:dkey-192k22.2 isoform X3 n=1 Tax=Cyclopterus lumpus TaxID=8103 RepID=UPI00148601D4|nr:uncharacterized protein si:dkey-192k22.2 isoform X3 [Cyclopterus lumpus]
MTRVALTKLLILVILAFIICLPEFFPLYTALKTHLEVSVELQLSDAETLNLTLYSGSNHSSLHFHPPGEEEEEEEEEEDGGDDEGQRRAFYCCLPVPLAAESANPRHCLLWLANRTVWSATAQEKLPWKRSQQDEWRCVLRALWLALLCVVMLTAVTTVLGLIYWKRRSCKNPDVLPLGYAVAGQQLNDGEKHTEIIIPKGTTFHSHGPRPRPGLSPIQEVDTQDDIETVLDGNVDHCYTANLHHRIHPSTSSLTEEQTC